MFLQFYRDYECDIFDICYEHGWIVGGGAGEIIVAADAGN